MKTCSPEIRLASVDDVSAMFRVRASVGENTMTPAELSAIGVTPQAIALAVESSPCAWVAIVAKEVVGFSMVDLDSGCLFALFVLPEHEGCGIGTRLTRPVNGLCSSTTPRRGLKPRMQAVRRGSIVTLDGETTSTLVAEMYGWKSIAHSRLGRIAAARRPWSRC